MKNILETLQRSRYVINLDDEDQARVRKIFQENRLPISGNERIQMVLDDSAFKNFGQVVVLTDKKIYWNLKSSHVELRTGDTLGATSGPSSISLKDLKAASVFVQNTSSGMVIHIIDGENKWIRITLKWFENDETLKMLFYYYLSRFVDNYNPSSQPNEERYGNYLKAHRGRSISVIPLVYDIFNHAIIAVLLLSMILPRFLHGNTFAGTEKILFLSVVVKLLGIIFHYRKSTYMNALLIIIIAGSFILPDTFIHIDNRYLWLGYAALSTLFSLFDFDRIFKYLVIVLVILSVAALFLQFFYLGPLF
ncbi:MAG: hypothetical protein LBT39_00665 [Treponema sp.]|jgi:hypothetical protein|nr:hypothetical protein [Treponema sp.]